MLLRHASHDYAAVICYHARWVVPVTAPPIQDGTVACDGGVIRYVGPRDGAPAGEPYELGDTLLLPGLVNTHTHLELTAMRGFLEGLSFPMWIDTLRRARGEVLTDDTLLDSARLGLLEGVQHGITTYADTSSSGVVLRAMRELHVRGIMYQELFGPDPNSLRRGDGRSAFRVEQLRADTTELVSLGISPHAPYTVSDALYRAAAEYAREQGSRWRCISRRAQKKSFRQRRWGESSPSAYAVAISPSLRAVVLRSSYSTAWGVCTIALFSFTLSGSMQTI